MKIVYVLNAIMALALIGVGSAGAEELKLTNSVSAIFVPKVIYDPDAGEYEESETYVMGGNNVAEAENVKFSSEGGTPTSSKLECDKGTQFTVSAETFHNICRVLVKCEQTGVYFVPSSISAKDAAGNIIDNPECFKKHINNSNFEYFGFSELLSEVTFTSSGNYDLVQVTAVLDIDPQFDAENGVTIYADEAVPFKKMSNMVSYLYNVEPSTQNKIEKGTERVPEDGIKLTGKPDGEYKVRVDIDSDEYSEYDNGENILTLNYKAVKPNDSTVGLTEIEADGDAAYFDLIGRRIVKPQRGQIHIRKCGSKAEIIR